MTSICHQAINCVQPNTQNSIVVGVIIASSNFKTFPSRSVYVRGTRAVWTFTLRDSENDTINVTVWGSEEYITNLCSNFHIGAVIDVINSKIQNRPVDDENQKYVPVTSSPYILTVNEGQSLIHQHEGPNKGFYESLLHIPMKDNSSVRSLKNIFENIDSLENQYVTLLVTVTFVGDSRNITTKIGDTLSCRDFEINDGTSTENVALLLWDNEWIQRSVHWKPKDTILFLSDVLVKFDNFKKKSAMKIVRKTVITENPSIPQAIEMKEKISQIDPDSMPHDPFIRPTPESITRVMTIKEIVEKLNESNSSANNISRVHFGTRLYGTVIGVTMGNSECDILITRCALCKRLVLKGNDSCMDLECPSGNGTLAPMNDHNFYLKVDLKDKTGYLIGCRLTGVAAERALACTVDEYKVMTQTQREELKLRLASRFCDVRLQVLGPTLTFKRALYNIISLNPIQIDDQ